MRSVLASAALGAVLLSAPRANAEDLVWRESWPHFRPYEYVTTATLGASVLTLYLLPRVPPRWGEPILFDKPARDALRSETDRGRSLGARLSTIAYWGMLVEPLLLQGPVVPLARGSSEVAAQVTLINLQSLAFAAFIFRASEVLVARARPYTWDCIKKEGSAEVCREHGVTGTNSFISGHSAIAATGAALICTNQYRLQIYGAVGGAISCGVALVFAGTAGIGRIVSDNHYATDVLAGWLVGAFSGWLVPSLLHYGLDGNGVGETRGATTTSAPLTIGYGGTFM